MSNLITERKKLYKNSRRDLWGKKVKYNELYIINYISEERVVVLRYWKNVKEYILALRNSKNARYIYTLWGRINFIMLSSINFFIELKVMEKNFK